MGLRGLDWTETMYGLWRLHVGHICYGLYTEGMPLQSAELMADLVTAWFGGYLVNSSTKFAPEEADKLQSTKKLFYDTMINY